MKHKALQKLRQTARRISAYQVPVYAANASFFILLSIFPGMMLLIGLLQYTPVTPSQLSELLSDVAPTALMPLLDYMTQELFAKMLREAAADSGRTVRVLELLMQSRDHPAALNADQSLYLKGYILQVL